MVGQNLEEELKRERKIVASLVHEIDYKNNQLLELEQKHDDTISTLRKLANGLVEKINFKDSVLMEWEHKYNTTVRRLMDEKANLHAEFVQEIRKVKSENLKLKRELRQRTKELEGRKSHNDGEGRTLVDEKEVPKENLPCQNLVEVNNASSDEVAALRKELEETSEELEDLDSRCNCLAVKLMLTNQELQHARKEAINGLKDMLNSRTTLGIKRMGDIDPESFEFACKLKFPDENWQEMSATLCSTWEENLRDPKWHPFKRICSNGNLKEVIDEDDEKLRELRNEYGEVAFGAVSTALLEMNEYNPSGRYPVSEIWNLKEGRRATMTEITEYIIKQLKNHKRKRKLT